MKMKQPKKLSLRKLPRILIHYDSDYALNELFNSNKTQSFIKKETLAAIKFAIENNEAEAKLFNISNLKHTVKIAKKNYKPALNKILAYFQNLEKYEECSEIKSMLNKL